MIAEQSGVHPAVIVALEFHDECATSKRASQAYRKLHRLAPARGERNCLGARYQGTELFRDEELEFVLRSIVVRQLGGLTDSLYHRWMLMAENERSPCQHVVDIPVAIHVLHSGPIGVLKEKNGLDGSTKGAACTAGEGFLRSLKKLLGAVPAYRLSHIERMRTVLVIP
jgi:hypothetical protein